MKRLKAGIIGCGLIVREKHIEAFRRLRSSVDVQAVCDIDVDLARKVAKDARIPNYYGDLTEMLDKIELDFVDICVPPGVHAPVAIQAIEHGCHVIMEKPMALTVQDCDSIIGKAKEHSSKVCIIHNNLFNPPMITARDMVKKGHIGDFIGMRILLSTPRWEMIEKEDHWYHRLPGGIIGETGPHMAYMALDFIGKLQDVDIFAKNVSGLPWVPFDEFRIIIDGSNGFCSTQLSYAQESRLALIDILGTRSSLHINLHSMVLVERKVTQLDPWSVNKTLLNSVFQMLSNAFVRFGKGVLRLETTGTNKLIEDFVTSIVLDQPVPVPMEKGRDAVELMERVVERLKEKYE